MRTRDSLEKLEEAREVYVKNKAPHTMAKFGVAFETPALNKPARTTDVDAEWKCTHHINREMGIDITIKIPEAASYRDVKEALHFAKNSIGDLVDKRVAEHHCEHLKKLTAFSEFKKALTVHRNDRMVDVRKVGLSLGEAEFMWQETESKKADEKIFTSYKTIADKAIAEAKKKTRDIAAGTLKTQKLVEAICLKKPQEFIDDKVTELFDARMKELGIKGKGKGKGKGFKVDHDGLVALSSSANFSMMSKEAKAVAVAKHVSVEEQPTNWKSPAVSAGDTRGRGRGRGRTSPRGRGRGNGRGKSSEHGDKGNPKGKDKGKGKTKDKDSGKCKGSESKGKGKGKKGAKDGKGKEKWSGKNQWR